MQLRRFNFRWLAVVAVAWVAVSVIDAGSTSVDLTASQDNTLYFSDTGAVSNGAGSHLFVGRTASGPGLRRALVQFDLTGQIPVGATILSASLTMQMNKTVALAHDIDVHRVLASWGEGSSNAPGAEGGGGQAANGDATWLHRFFPGTFWAVAGGDFVPDSSATTSVANPGSYTWGSTAKLVDDVQTWVNDPSGNHGWVLIGEEILSQTAKRFTSRHSTNVSLRPTLTVEYTVEPVSAGQVPDGKNVPGSQLLLDKTAISLRLFWDASCRPTDTDYGVYRGDLGDFTNRSSVKCSTLGSTVTSIAMPVADSYYLVVPNNADFEGSYGRDSNGVERLQSSGACRPQSIEDPVCTPSPLSLEPIR